jgi:putative oxidoreductase
MNKLQQIENWGNAHHPKWLDFVRMLLGVIIMGMGILFVQHRDDLDAMIKTHPALTVFAFFIAHYIVFVHIVGGLFIAMGLYTRLCSFLNIPVLLGAVFFIHSPTGLFAAYPLMGLSIVVLFLLIVFLIEGSGRISVDDYMRRHPEKHDFMHPEKNHA